MQPFQYSSSLRDSGRTQVIRVIELHPDTDDAPISCTLREVSLLSKPKYHAISYCWGGQTPSKPVICNEASLLITENLWDGLHRFRCPDAAKFLWADAICINQADSDEKNAQVPLMGEIYRQADGVLVWLGKSPDEAGASDLKRQVEEMQGMVTRVQEKIGGSLDDMWRNLSVEKTTTGLRRIMPKHHTTVSHLPALDQLFMNPWWSRVWVIQEIALAPAEILVCLGRSTFQWTAVAAAYTAWWHVYLCNGVSSTALWKQLRHPAGVLFMLEVRRALADQANPANLGIMWLLHKSTFFQATDARDNVYALLGMVNAARSPVALAILPDYRADVTVVYQQVMEKLIARFPILYALLGVGMGNNGDGAVGGLPSWVIDWTASRLSAISDFATGA